MLHYFNEYFEYWSYSDFNDGQKKKLINLCSNDGDPSLTGEERISEKNVSFKPCTTPYVDEQCVNNILYNLKFGNDVSSETGSKYLCTSRNSGSSKFYKRGNQNLYFGNSEVGYVKENMNAYSCLSGYEQNSNMLKYWKGYGALPVKDAKDEFESGKIYYTDISDSSFADDKYYGLEGYPPLIKHENGVEIKNLNNYAWAIVWNREDKYYRIFIPRVASIITVDSFDELNGLLARDIPNKAPRNTILMARPEFRIFGQFRIKADKDISISEFGDSVSDVLYDKLDYSNDYNLEDTAEKIIQNRINNGIINKYSVEKCSGGIDCLEPTNDFDDIENGYKYYTSIRIIGDKTEVYNSEYIDYNPSDIAVTGAKDVWGAMWDKKSPWKNKITYKEANYPIHIRSNLDEQTFNSIEFGNEYDVTVFFSQYDSDAFVDKAESCNNKKISIPYVASIGTDLCMWCIDPQWALSFGDDYKTYQLENYLDKDIKGLENPRKFYAGLKTYANDFDFSDFKDDLGCFPFPGDYDAKFSYGGVLDLISEKVHDLLVVGENLGDLGLKFKKYKFFTYADYAVAIYPTEYSYGE